MAQQNLINQGDEGTKSINANFVKTQANFTELYASQSGVTNVASFGASPDASATVNAEAIQAALDVGGLVEINVPGIYNVGDANASDPDTCLYIGSNTSLYLGRGVTLKQATASKCLFINKNWKSNSAAVVSVSHVYDSPTAGSVISTYNTGTVNHGLSVGDYAYVKNDTAGQINGIFKVLTVDITDTDNHKFTVNRFGRNASVQFSAFAGSPIVYKADYGISFFGEGRIDYNFKGSTGVRAMGATMNKVGALVWKILAVNATKYGLYGGNIINCRTDSADFRGPSAAVQFIGPCADLLFENLYGEASDDPWAITTSNAGFTAYDMTDADGTKNTDGPVHGVTVLNNNLSAQKTRSMLFAASSDGDIYGIYINRARSGPLCKGAAVQFGVPSGHTGSIHDLHIGSVQAEVGPSNEVSIPIQLVEEGTGTLHIKQARIDSIEVCAVDGSSGAKNHVVNIGTAAGSVNLSVGSIICDVNLDSSGNISAIYAAGAGPHNICCETILAKTTNSTRSFKGLSLFATSPSVANIGYFTATGPKCGAVGCFSAGHRFSIGKAVINSSEGRVFDANNQFFGSVASSALLHASSTGHFNCYGTVAATSELYVGNTHGACALFTNMTHEKLKFSLAGGLVSSVGTVTGKLVLAGNCCANGLAFNGSTHLESTGTQHAPGASFYNSDAGFGAGAGAYVRGSSTWSRVAA